ncbi:MAG TPA: hypothetical protein VMT64_02120, partial [Candidatus Binataceae bacterium]|nr:hypothetical protein [Candidatus Binataceae bacterium]
MNLSDLFRRFAGPAVPILACGLCVALFRSFSSGIDYHAIIHAARATPRELVWTSILFTALSYFALIARDDCALVYIGAKVAAAPLLLASCCGSALGNAIGYGPLTGEAVRDRVYGAAGLRPEQIDRVMLFIDAGFGLGLAAFIAATAMLSGPALAGLLGLPAALVRLPAAMLLLATLGLIVLGVRHQGPFAFAGVPLSMPSPRIALVQQMVTGCDLTAAALALRVLLPASGIDFFSFAAIFSTATALGNISRVPGGVGIFETVVYLGLARYMPHNQLAAALLIYRGVYFLLPPMLAGAALAGFELRSDAVVRGGSILPGADLLAPIFLSVITFSIGVMLILSGATPAVDWRLAALQGVLPLWAVEISHLLATLAGVFLLFVSRGLYHRLDGAWWLALLLALVNVGFSLTKGLAFGETAAILFLLFLLLATRRQFTRPAAFLRRPFTIGWFIAITAVIAAAIGIMLFAFRDVAYRREIWWQFEFDAQASRAMRALLGASLLAVGISLWQLMRTASGRIELPSARQLASAASIVRGQERSAALLALMGDKSFLFSR